MIILLALRSVIALAIIWGAARYFRDVGQVWRKPISDFEPDIRPGMVLFHRAWFLLNSGLLVCCITFACCIVVRPSWALRSLLGFPIVLVACFVGAKLTRKPLASARKMPEPPER